MSDSFDPYLKWLGIRNIESGVNHYRLLGLELFESDVDAIANAAERQIRHVESCAAGEFDEIGRKLIAEIRLARNCLLDIERRAVYDQSLRATTDADDPREILTESDDAPVMIRTAGKFASNRGSAKRAPAIRARKRRPKRSSGFDFAGWILGAVGAVVFAYVLLNTDLIERIKGTAGDNPGKEASFETSDGANNVPEKVASDKSSRPSTAPSKKSNNKRRRRTRPANQKTPEIVKGESGNLASSGLSNQPNRSNPKESNGELLKKNPIPDRAAIQQASKEISEKFEQQISDSNVRVKQALAKELLELARNEDRPAQVFALADTAANVAADIGEVSWVVAAVGLLEQRFEIDYWSRLQESVSKSLLPDRDFEMVAKDVGLLFKRARSAEAFKFCVEIAKRSSLIAKKWGDEKQVEMLDNFSRDMKALLALKRDYEKILTDNAPPKSKGDLLIAGKYLCFGKGDWEKGLEYLAKGSDGALASVAQADHESQGKNTATIVQQWSTLSMKPKYKGLDRRCMLERVQDKLAESTRVPNEREYLQTILQNIQVIKNFVDDPQARTRKVQFGTIKIGNNSLGPIVFENARFLVIGPRRDVRLSTRKTDDGYYADFNQARLQFKIRFMDNGFAEMRVRNIDSNRYTIWYGK